MRLDSVSFSSRWSLLEPLGNRISGLLALDLFCKKRSLSQGSGGLAWLLPGRSIAVETGLLQGAACPGQQVAQTPAGTLT